MKLKKTLLYAIPASLMASTTATYAVCPLCVIAIGAGLGLSEYFGIDDTISGLWIGALLWGIVDWTIRWFDRKHWLKSWVWGRDLLIFLLYYGLTIWPLWEKGYIGNPFHQLWGIDKLLLGIGLGTITLIVSDQSYEAIKKANGGHAQFPYQKVVMPIIALAILSVIFYFIVTAA